MPRLTGYRGSRPARNRTLSRTHFELSQMVSFLRDFWVFLNVRKKFWLLPIFIVLGIFGGLIALTKGTAVAPVHLHPVLTSAWMRVLGVSAFYHDSAAAIVEDGRIIAAAQEERFTRKKFDASYPRHAIDYCLESAGAKLADVDFVAFYDKPFLKFERLLETYLAFSPHGFASFSLVAALNSGDHHSVTRRGLLYRCPQRLKGNLC